MKCITYSHNLLSFLFLANNYHYINFDYYYFFSICYTTYIFALSYFLFCHSFLYVVLYTKEINDENKYAHFYYFHTRRLFFNK